MALIIITSAGRQILNEKSKSWMQFGLLLSITRKQENDATALFSIRIFLDLKKNA
jgi:hypothetical protein